MLLLQREMEKDNMDMVFVEGFADDGEQLKK